MLILSFQLFLSHWKVCKWTVFEGDVFKKQGKKYSKVLTVDYRDGSGPPVDPCTVHQSPIRNDISGRVSIYVCTMLNRPLHLFPIWLAKYEEAWVACDLCWEWCMKSFLKQPLPIFWSCVFFLTMTMWKGI